MANLRLFVAADLPEALLAAVGRLQARLRPDFPSVRWLDPKGMHLTLKFLGSVPEEQLGAVTTITQEVARASAPSTLTTTQIDAYPAWRSPRVVALGCTVPEELATLYHRLDTAYEALGVAPESPGSVANRESRIANRKFRPHITLGRAKERRPLRLERPEGTVPEQAIPVGQIVLYQSLPGAAGSRYVALGRFALGS